MTLIFSMSAPQVVVLLAVLCAASSTPVHDSGTFNLSVIHFNDFHARFDETSWKSTSCRQHDDCIGGMSRLYAGIKMLKAQKPDSIVLDGGDNFQGTIWFNYFKWNVTAFFHNKLPVDATVLGNHEFDNKIAGVVPYMQNLKSPIVVSNLDDRLVPEIQGLYTKSITVTRNGKKIGIIGVLTSRTKVMSSSGKLEFYDESKSINAEAERLVKEEGVFTNIVLSHCGYDVEQLLAANATGKISLIVGGHSHSLLYTGEPVPGPDKPWGPYPTQVTGADGQMVLVVQASAYTKYLGNLTISYDAKGNFVSWTGKPIFLSSDFPQDEGMNAALLPWKEELDVHAKKVLGESLVVLDKTACYTSECLLGDFLTDALVDYFEGTPLGPVSIGITNAGGIRTAIDKGNITYADLMECAPFENTIDVGSIQGKYVKQFLEHGVHPYDYGRIASTSNLLQLSGLRVVYDLSRPVNQSVVSVKVRCAGCKTPTFQDLDMDRMYRIAMPSFLSTGGDGYSVFTDHVQDMTVGPVDNAVYMAYIKKRSPIFQQKDGRITTVNGHHVYTRNVDM